MIRFLFLILCLNPLFCFAQRDTIVRVYIASYRNDAAGAYTLIHDDFGAEYARGIEQYADTMAFNRRIPFSFAIITKECDEQNWKSARELIKHGHQPVNHTHSHLCGTPQSWCTFGDWNEKDFPVEIDQSTQLIQSHTGMHPAFFIYPYDLHTDTMVTYLMAKGYAGTRAGVQNKLQMSAGLNPFQLNYNVLRPEQPFSVCNQFADQAIAKNGWAIRVMHGIQDESWGAPTTDMYREHLDYLKQKSDSGLLWIATLSDVLWYITLQKKYEVIISQSSTKAKQYGVAVKRVEKISFVPVTTAGIYNPDETENEKTLKATAYHKTVTVVLMQPVNDAHLRVYQNNKRVHHSYAYSTSDGDKILIEANPEAGDIILEYIH